MQTQMIGNHRGNHNQHNLQENKTCLLITQMAILAAQTRTLPVYFLEISINKCMQKRKHNYKTGNRQDDASSNRWRWRESKQRKRECFPLMLVYFVCTNKLIQSAF